MENRRDIAVDIAKTIGIALVVVGHISGSSEGSGLVCVRDFIYQFHIPLFFFLSGYCYKANESWSSFIVKKLRRLYIPFIVWNLVFFAVHILAHSLAGERLNGLDIIKRSCKLLLGLDVTPLGGATWFLITLLQALLLYKLITTIFKNQPTWLVVLFSALFGFLGSFLYLPWGLGRTLVAVPFICAGHYTRTFNLLGRVKPCLQLSWSALGLCLLVVFSRINRPDMALQQYGMIPLFWVAAFVGVYTVLLLCIRVSSVGLFIRFSYWGQRTMWILIGHFAAFKLVSLAQIADFNHRWDILFAHPCNEVCGLWPLAYFACGFFLPLALSRLSELWN